MKTITAPAAKKTAETTAAKISESLVVETQNNGLTPEQKAQKLTECEATIQTGQSAFFATAYAVKTIRDEKLFLLGYKTMGEYFEEKWDFTPSDISRFTNAADVLDALKKHKVRQLPTMEGHTRALAELCGTGKDKNFDKCVPIWVDALNSKKKITGALIRELANPKSEADSSDQKDDAPANPTVDSVAQNTPHTSDKTITATVTMEISLEGVLNLMESGELQNVSVVTRTETGAVFKMSAPDKAGVFAKLAEWSLADLIGSATVKF